jgi:hypothetical protein
MEQAKARGDILLLHLKGEREGGTYEHPQIPKNRKKYI